ncbi:MAG: glycosyltransferase family 4 protein [Bacillota bacterium]
MSKLRVLHVIGGGEFGGAERHILNLAAALDPAEATVAVACLFARPFAEMAGEAGLEAYTFPMRRKFDFRVVGPLARLAGEFDLVHTHGVRANLIGRLAARRAGRPVVTTVHSLLAFDYPGLAGRLVNALAERFSRHLTAHFIAVSQALKDALVRGGIPEEKITVVYNGVTVAAPHVPRETLRARLGYAPDTPLVGIVARLHRVKGHQVFLTAAREVLARRPGVKFLVVGAGPERQALEALARELEIGEAVRFTGFVTDVGAVMAALDVLVVASYWEGFGLTAAEALGLGVPVISTSAGGLGEVVRHGETGLLVPPGNAGEMANAVLWILDHPEEARVMTERGGQLVRREFTPEKMARQTLQVYRKVLAQAGPGQGST